MNKKQRIELRDKQYFVLFKGKESYLCSWFENEPDFYGRKVHYVGVTDGLGGYRQMLAKGFTDRRFNKPERYTSKTIKYIYNKRRNEQKRKK